MKKFIVGQDRFEVENLSSSGVRVNGIDHDIEFVQGGGYPRRLRVDNHIYDVLVKLKSETTLEIWINHHVLSVTIHELRSQLLSRLNDNTSRGHSPYSCKAPMPGLINTIEVTVGEIVQLGTGLLILEAMKMENEIRSPIYGRIKSIAVKNQMTVEKGEELLIIEPLSQDKND